MKTRLISLQIGLILSILLALANAGPCGTLPSGLSGITTGCYPLNLTNGQTVATPLNFQQLLTGLPFNASQGKAYIYNSISGQCLPSMAMNSTVMYMQLFTNTIAPIFSVNGIYFIGKTSSSVFGNSAACSGSAPAVTTTYGQFWNGNTMFPQFAEDFIGQSLNTTLWNTAGTMTVSNGVTTGAATSYILSKNTYNSLNYTLEFTGRFFAVNSGGGNSGAGWGGCCQAPPIAADINPTFGSQYTLWNFNAGPNAVPLSGWSVNSNAVYSAWANASESFALVNYTHSKTNPNQFGAVSNQFIAFINDGVTSNSTWQYVFLRATPPKGVMPSMVIGAFIPIGGATTTTVTFTTTTINLPPGTLVTSCPFFKQGILASMFCGILVVPGFEIILLFLAGGMVYMATKKGTMAFAVDLLISGYWITLVTNPTVQIGIGGAVTILLIASFYWEGKRHREDR